MLEYLHLEWRGRTHYLVVIRFLTANMKNEAMYAKYELLSALISPRSSFDIEEKTHRDSIR